MRARVVGAAVSLGLAATGFAGCQVQAGNPFATAGAKCEGLAKVSLSDARVTSAGLVRENAGADGIKLPKSAMARLPTFCRVQVTDKPSADSDIRIELWLPVEKWNGKFRATGNGGFAGNIYFDEMAGALAEGYATAGTDTGHTGADGPAFALGHPEKVKDFGWRAVHDMTVEAKVLLAAFYGKPQTKAYFAGCSDGGREALMEAERFPADYDGILAGAPAWNWTGLISGAASTVKWMAANPLPAAKIPVLAAAVVRACDARDGVKDGVLNDPRQCGFDPATIVCKEGDEADCLTEREAATVKSLYLGAHDAVGNELVPGVLPGGEDGSNGWATWITGTPKAPSLGRFFSEGFFANFVHEDPAWRVQSFDPERDPLLARKKTAAALDANDLNLKPFLDRGGKLILYHGWDDPGIPAKMTLEFYAGVQKALGDAATEAAVRLYMVPGMQHCGGGPGATEFGAGALTMLEQWVEAGRAPGTIVASKVGAQKQVEFTRPLCAYPAEAKYVGGDTTEAKSFVCAVPGK